MSVKYMTEAPIFAVSRHRINIDGKGVVTLVCFGACPLACRYCINKTLCFNPARWTDYTPQQLFDKVKIDNLYFLATNGGITFGGGEPLLHSDFVREFCRLTPKEWKINIETSLNVPDENIKPLLPFVDKWIIDIKDMNPNIYLRYTGSDNARVISNLQLLADAGKTDSCVVRIPLIKNYNTDKDRQKSISMLRELGFADFDMLNYIIKNN